MINKCKQNTDVCCHCEKDVNKISKQDQECFHSYKVNNAREHFSLECTKCGATWSDKIRAINHLIKEVDRVSHNYDKVSDGGPY